MWLPEQIPERLRERAVFLPGFADGEGAWSRDDAIAVIGSLKSTIVPVSDVILFERAPWGYAPSHTVWSADRLPNEPDADYALRSRVGAIRFIRECEDRYDEPLFALTFPMWKDAA